MRIKFGASMQWWQFDHHNEANLIEEAEILKSWGLREVRIITPSPPTWQTNALCTAEYAYEAQIKITSVLRRLGISTTFVLANSLSSIIALFKKPEYRKFWEFRGENDYEACVDLIHYAIIARNSEVLDLIEQEYDRYSPIYDMCQLINAGELFLFNGRNHFDVSTFPHALYNRILNIKKFLTQYKHKNVFWNSANVYLQGDNVNDFMSLAVPFGFANEIKYVSEFNITDIPNPERRAEAFGVAMRKLVLDFNVKTICFHSPLGGWFVLDENKEAHKLWTVKGQEELLSNPKYLPFERNNSIRGDKFNLFLEPVFSDKLKQVIKTLR